MSVRLACTSGRPAPNLAPDVQAQLTERSVEPPRTAAAISTEAATHNPTWPTRIIWSPHDPRLLHRSGPLRVVKSSDQGVASARSNVRVDQVRRRGGSAGRFLGTSLSPSRRNASVMTQYWVAPVGHCVTTRPDADVK